MQLMMFSLAADSHSTFSCECETVGSQGDNVTGISQDLVSGNTNIEETGDNQSIYVIPTLPMTNSNRLPKERSVVSFAM